MVVDCKSLGERVRIIDNVSKYGDWLFKQPLILALKKSGFKITASGNRFPVMCSKDKRRQADWALVLTRRDKERLSDNVLQNFDNVIEIKRTSRNIEVVKLWRGGALIASKRFKSLHEQERIRSIAKYLGLPYQERSIEILKPRGKIITINMNVGENNEDRLALNASELKIIIVALRAQGYRFKVIKSSELIPGGFYEQFKDGEILTARSFEEACKIIDVSDFYFGADSGLAHYAVQSGKIVFSLFSKKYHSRIPLFQSTFRNHLCYLGDSSFSKQMLSDMEIIRQACPDKYFLEQIDQFLENGSGINPDPYSNERKVFVLKMSFFSQNEYRINLAREIHANSASIFFTDEVVGLDIIKLRPISGRMFIDSKNCVEQIFALIRKHRDFKNISFYGKSCSFFYGTAMKDGSSDLDIPTIHSNNKIRNRKKLLREIEATLNKFGLSTNLPHQTPVFSRNIPGLRPIIKNGHESFSVCSQQDEYNLQKYEARVKIKIILGEMDRAEREKLNKSLAISINGKRLLKEIEYLEKDTINFKQWSVLIRKIINATSILGGFGTKGHVFLKIDQDFEGFSNQASGLMRHGVIYIVGLRLYPLWNIRRPQHGWFQPITLLTNHTKVFERRMRSAIKSPIYSSQKMRLIKLMLQNKLSQKSALKLLGSPNPLIFMEAYRYVAFNNKKFSNHEFPKKELAKYARESYSNCDNSRDRRISLWSLATGGSLPLSAKDIHYLRKYNCFVQCFCSGETFDINQTSFFSSTQSGNISARNFVQPFFQRMIRLLREYYLYTLTNGLPKEFLYEKRKEIAFVYFVQGRSILEGPAAQSNAVLRFLRKLKIESVFFDGRTLREFVNAHPISIPRPVTQFFLAWLIRQNEDDKMFPRFFGGSGFSKMILPSYPSLHRPLGEIDS